MLAASTDTSAGALRADAATTANIRIIDPANGKMGPKTRQAYWNYEHGVKEWDQKLYLKFPHTEEEVKEYQKENGLEPVGNIGPKTIKLLIELHTTLTKKDSTI